MALPACALLLSVGCAYLPPALPPDAPLLVYFRGHHPSYGARVPDSACSDSARQAFARYGLGETAAAERVAILVVCSSDRGLDSITLDSLEDITRRRFPRRVLAAHSGGYEGLFKSLDSGVTAERVLMLDNFYFEEDRAVQLQRLISRGMSCAGYLTEHNLRRYRERFAKTAACAVERQDALGHSDAVNRCLGAYLRGPTCAGI